MNRATLKLISVLASAILVTACSSDDDDSPVTTFLGDSVTVANTFEDAIRTSGAQIIYRLSDPTAVSDPEIELPNFINFYDMDFSSNSLVMTLVNNTDASDLVIPEGRFDRYYIGFAANGITSVTLDGTSELNEFASVSLLPTGFSLDALNPLELDVPLPIDFALGGILVELGAGTDLTNTGVTVKVNFE